MLVYWRVWGFHHQTSRSNSKNHEIHFESYHRWANVWANLFFCGPLLGSDHLWLDPIEWGMPKTGHLENRWWYNCWILRCSMIGRALMNSEPVHKSSYRFPATLQPKKLNWATNCWRYYPPVIQHMEKKTPFWPYFCRPFSKRETRQVFGTGLGGSTSNVK
jgi:hypothetical protein